MMWEGKSLMRPGVPKSHLRLDARTRPHWQAVHPHFSAVEKWDLDYTGFRTLIAKDCITLSAFLNPGQPEN